MHFPYKSQDGILHYLYKKDKKYYKNNKIFSFASSGYKEPYLIENAFDFNDSTYWYSKEEATEHFISFCFLKGFVDLEKYEIHTSLSGDDIPYKWAFYGSNDNKAWTREENVTQEIEKGQSAVVEWRNGIFRCFKLILIKNSRNNLPSDLRQIELFGTYYPNPSLRTCYNKHKPNNLIILTLILTSYQ